MMTITTSSSSKVKPLDLSIGPPFYLVGAGWHPKAPAARFLLVDAELHRRRARLVRADVRRRELVVEVRQPERAAIAGARRVELIHAARLALPAVARRVDRRSDDTVGFVAGDVHVAVVQVVVQIIAAARRTDRAPPALPDLQD